MASSDHRCIPGHPTYFSGHLWNLFHVYNSVKMWMYVCVSVCFVWVWESMSIWENAFVKVVRLFMPICASVSACVCKCVWMCISMCLCEYVCICLGMSVYVCVRESVYVWIYTWVCVSLHMSMYRSIHMSVSVWVCMWVCVCAFMCVHERVYMSVCECESLSVYVSI